MERLETEAWTYCMDRRNDCSLGTQWSGAFAFNAACLMITGINFLVMVLGAYFFAVRLFASIFNCCYGCCHCLAFATALGVRWNPLGQICSHNVAPSTFKDDKWSDTTTYESDASVLNTLGMVSAFIWCC